MTYVIKILDGPFTGLYLEEYDPSRNGLDPAGRPMIAHVMGTSDPSLAMRFDDRLEAWDCWRQVDPREPVRKDGKPNRPLTAFTITVMRSTE